MKRKNILYKLNLKERELSILTRKIIRDSGGNIFDVFANAENEAKPIINPYGLSQKEVDMLLDQIVLQGKIPDGGFLYSRDKHDNEGKQNGATKFSAVAKAPLYNREINMSENEIMKDNTLDEIISQLSRKKKTHIELGPETWEKFIAYANERDPLYSHLQGKKYVWVDVSGVYVDLANKNVEKIGMESESILGDWFKHSVFDSAKDQIYYFFGGGINNLDIWSISHTQSENGEKTITNLLRRMRANQPLKSVPAVITYFEAPDQNDPQYQDKVERLRATYGAKDSKYYDEWTHTAISDFILSGFEALGIDKSKLELLVEYDDTILPPAIKVWAKCIERTEIQIGNNKVIKEKGDCIRAIKSQRLSRSLFEKTANDAGFLLKYQKGDKGVVVAVLQSKLWMQDKFKTGRNIIYWGLASLMLLWSWLKISNTMRQREIQKEIQKQQEKTLKNKNLYVYCDLWAQEYKTPEQKDTFINGIANDISKSIKVRYDIKLDIISLIKDELLQWDNIDAFFDSWSREENVVEFADDFINKHKNFLLESGAKIVPYAHLKEYEENFKRTINCDFSNEEAKSKFNVTYANGLMKDITDVSWTTVSLWWYQSLSGGEYDMGTYRGLKSTGGSFSMSFSSTGKEGYIYATFAVNDEDTKQNYPHEYTLSESKVVAFDYYEQTRPVVRKILKYYDKAFQNADYDAYSYNKYGWTTIQNDRREMIIKDLVNTWKIDQIDEGSDSAIAKYVVDFVAKNKGVLQTKKIDVTPYDTLRRYEGALKNTISADNDRQGNQILLINDTLRGLCKFNYLGVYLTQKGERYDMGSILVDGIPYIVWREKDHRPRVHVGWEEYVDRDYYIFMWATIAEDYFALKRKF